MADNSNQPWLATYGWLLVGAYTFRSLPRRGDARLMILASLHRGHRRRLGSDRGIGLHLLLLIRVLLQGHTLQANHKCEQQ